MKGFSFFCYMKKLIVMFVLFSIHSFGQIDGQNFCDGNKSGSYFPLDIRIKKIVWFNTFYFEKRINTKSINGIDYIEFEQKWEDKSIDLLYLRELDGKVFQFDEKKKTEFLRFDKSLKEQQSWSDSGNEYKIIMYNGVLITPYCFYKDLLILEAKYPKVTYKFYYLKGFGYVGATRDDKLISYIKPEIN
ncbi:MAG: hypothetical protein V4670_03080 [Bacteroidota bacterium]